MSSHFVIRFLAFFFFLFISELLCAQPLKLGLPIGNKDHISDLQFSPDEKNVLTISGGSIFLWDFSSSKLIYEFSRAGKIATFNDNGKEIITIDDISNYQETIYYRWSVATGELIEKLSFEKTDNYFQMATISPDGKYLIRNLGAGLSSGTLEIRNLANGEVLYLMEVAGLISKEGVVFSNDSKEILVHTRSADFKMWRLKDGKVTHDIKIEEYQYGFIGSAVISGNNDMLAFSVDSNVVVFDLNQKRAIKKYKMNGNQISMMSFSENNDKLAILTPDNFQIIRLRDDDILYSSEEIGQFELLENGNKILDRSGKILDWSSNTVLKKVCGYTTLLRNRDKFFVTDDTGVVEIWDSKSLTKQWEIRSRVAAIQKIYELDSNKVLKVYEDGWIEKFDLKSGKVNWTVRGFQESNRIMSSYDVDSKQLVLITQDETGTLIRFWNVSKEKLIRELEFEKPFGYIEHTVPPSGNYVFLKGMSELQVWDARSSELIASFTKKKRLSAETFIDVDIADYALAPDESKLAIKWGNFHIEIYDVKSLQSLFVVPGINNESSPKWIEGFSEDSKTFVYYTKSVFENKDFTTYLDANTKEILKEVDGYTLDFSNIPYNKDSSLYLVKNKLYTKPDSKLRSRFDEHDSEITSILLSSEDDFAVSSSTDGSIIIWDTNTGKSLVRNFIFENDPNKWVHLTKEGYFDASPETMELMYWTKGKEIIEFGQLKDRFWVPGLWERVIKGEKIQTSNTRQLKDVAMYPKVDLIHPNRNGDQLGIQLVDQGGGYGEVSILINGKEINRDARGASFDQTLDSVAFNYSLTNHPFLKPGEINTIEVSAYNREGYVVSKPKKIYYMPNGTKSDYAPVLYAILVGSADYIGDNLDLSFPSKDAKAFADALRVSSKNLLGIDNVKIELLTTSQEGEMWPSKKNIQTAYNKVSKKARPYDIVVFYFAGHGVNYGGGDGDFYYLTASAINGNLKDDAIRSNVAISSNELTSWINEIPALKQVLIFDACHSGQFANDLFEKRELRPASEVKSLERMKDRTGMYILSGSAADAVSYEANMYGQGLLTYSLLFGMKGASLRDNQYVDVIKLFQYAADKVPELAKNIGGIQEPEVRVPFGGDSFDLGYLNPADKDNIQLPSPKPIFVRSSFQNEMTFDDDLELSDLINGQLKEEQQEETNSLVFIDVSKFSNAYSIRGQYSQEGDEYKLKANLINNGRIIKSFHLKNTSKDELCNDIINLSIETLSASNE